MNPLFVVVPFYNEGAGIEATLEALAAQTDRDFALVCVDNASSDDGPELVRAFQARHPEMEIHLIREPVKGTGTASDTGFRFAIEAGATRVLRTDADCVPDRDWVRASGAPSMEARSLSPAASSRAGTRAFALPTG